MNLGLAPLGLTPLGLRIAPGSSPPAGGFFAQYYYDLQDGNMFKNVASKVTFFVFDATTGLPKTGDAANLTAYVAKDFGAVTALTDTSATEDSASNAPGDYTFDVTQAESNADDLKFTCKSSTANIVCVPRFISTTPNLFTTLAISAAGRVDLGLILGTAVSTPATAGVLDVNAKNINNVAATSVTAINANIGTTQPVNFTGTAGSALVKGDAIDLAGQAITAAAGVTFPSSVASPTNITAATGITVATNNDKTGYGLSAAAVQAIWDALTSALTTVGSIGKKLADWTIGTAQTGDAYAIVNDSSFGNSKLVRATTPANTLDVSSTGEAGLDFNNIKDATGAHTLTNITVPVVTTTTTATNLTNAPTSGDLTATMKASVTTAATAATPTAAAVTGAVGSVTAGVTVTTNNDKTGYGLSSAAVIAIWAYVIEGAHTAVGYMRLFASALASKLSGAATPTVKIRDIDDTKDRITASVDADGNRTAVTTDET